MLVTGGADDFHGLRQYVPGDSLKHMAWKPYARRGDMVVKEFAGYADRRTWLDWDAMPGVETETRLSRLCGLALEHEARHLAYGLRLPGRVIEPALGGTHREEVLKALALHGIDDAQPVTAHKQALTPAQAAP